MLLMLLLMRAGPPHHDVLFVPCILLLYTQSTVRGHMCGLSPWCYTIGMYVCVRSDASWPQSCSWVVHRGKGESHICQVCLGAFFPSTGEKRQGPCNSSIHLRADGGASSRHLPDGHMHRLKYMYLYEGCTPCCIARASSASAAASGGWRARASSQAH